MSEKKKPVTPYARLLGIAQKYALDIKYARTLTMFVFKKSSLTASYTLDDVAQRVHAANQLGYDCMMVMSNDGDLIMQYRKRVVVPWELH